MGDDPKPRRSQHAEQRGQEGRRVSPAFNDAQRARKNDVFIDQATERYLVRGPRGREHVFETDGEHVTTVDRPNSAHIRRLRSGRIRELSDNEFTAFEELFK